MFALPFTVLGMWLRGLVALAILAGGIYLVSWWYRDLPTHEVVVVRDAQAPPDAAATQERAELGRPLGPTERITAWHPGLDRITAALVGGLCLLLIACAGRGISSGLLGRPGGGERFDHREGQALKLRRPDG